MTVTSMLDVDDMRDIISEFQIRPGGLWCYEADVDDYGSGPVIELVAYTRDSRDERYFEEFPPDELPVPLTFTYTLTDDDMMTEQDFVDAVCRAVASFAAHEALEWTRYKGRMAHDPHTDGDVVAVFR
jgi:hypothetical protein